MFHPLHPPPSRHMGTRGNSKATRWAMGGPHVIAWGLL